MQAIHVDFNIIVLFTMEVYYVYMNALTFQIYVIRHCYFQFYFAVSTLGVEHKMWSEISMFLIC